MRYNLANKPELDQAFEYITKLTGQEAIVNITKVNPKRTLNQNNYLHLLLGAFGDHFGYTLEEAKEIFKDISKDIFYYEKKGRTFKRSSADLDTKELTIAIDRFMAKSAEAGCPLPIATNEEWLRSIENTMEGSMYL